jgi:hypothetical protein
MLDEIIKGDGGGRHGRAGRGRRRVGIADGRIVAIGTIDEPAANARRGDGLVVAPPSTRTPTHAVARDPTASPSSAGVTTVIGGNCGFSLALPEDGDADYLRRMMARVEGMPPPRPEQASTGGRRSASSSTGFEGAISVNAGFLAGHCAHSPLRHGARTIGAARPRPSRSPRCAPSRPSLDAERSLARSRSRRRTVTATASRWPAGGPRPRSSSR